MRSDRMAALGDEIAGDRRHMNPVKASLDLKTHPETLPFSPESRLSTISHCVAGAVRNDLTCFWWRIDLRPMTENTDFPYT